MTVIEASSYTSRVLVDGTLAMVIHIDPKMRDAAMRLFGAPGTAMAIAALKPAGSEPKPEPKRGLLSQWAAMRCGEGNFRAWLGAKYPAKWEHFSQGGARDGGETAADVVRMVCQIDSRAELDTDERAAKVFHDRIRAPWADHCNQTEAA